MQNAYSWTAFSETGRREENEDSWGMQRTAAGLAVFAVADGLGGHADGAVASRAAIRAFLDAACQGDLAPAEAVERGISGARAAVRRLESTDEAPPSSTIVALAMNDAEAAIGHVGDSRLVVLRSGRIVDQTRDHNVREMLRQAGRTDAPPAVDDPDASKLTRTLDQPLEGAEAVRKIPLQSGDLVLLCSDGVSQHLPESDGSIIDLDADDTVLIECVRTMVDRAALARQDNYTAIAVKLGGSGVRGAHARPTDAPPDAATKSAAGWRGQIAKRLRLMNAEFIRRSIALGVAAKRRMTLRSPSIPGFPDAGKDR